MSSDRVPITVRKATLADAGAVAEVFHQSWSHAYVGIIPALHLLNLVRRRDAAWWRNAIRTERHLLVLEVDDAIVGYATCGPSRGGWAGYGEIFELYVSPVYQGLGLGEHLFEACRNRLDIENFGRLVVWALADNGRAREFYENRGGRICARAKERFSQKTLDKVAFGWA